MFTVVIAIPYNFLSLVSHTHKKPTEMNENIVVLHV